MLHTIDVKVRYPRSDFYCDVKFSNLKRFQTKESVTITCYERVEFEFVS